MAEFTLDTLGAVAMPSGPLKPPMDYTWEGLTPFQQGYVEAAARDLWERLPWLARGETSTSRVAFSRWSPEALALILRDCERGVTCFLAAKPTNSRGRLFWAERLEGDLLPYGFPPLTAYLSDDGKVCLKEAARG